MDDRTIITLYHNRDEAAIAETQNKYDTFCHRIAMNILTVPEDAEECVNDTYLAAWGKMPPEFPASLPAFLGRITRNISISLFRKKRALKRYNGMEIMLSELEDCIPSPHNVEETTEANELSRHISLWLNTLTPDDRALFVLRYWNGESLNTLAGKMGCTDSRMAQRMLKLRHELKKYLEKEGVSV